MSFNPPCLLSFTAPPHCYPPVLLLLQLLLLPCELLPLLPAFPAQPVWQPVPSWQPLVLLTVLLLLLLNALLLLLLVPNARPLMLTCPLPQMPAYLLQMPACLLQMPACLLQMPACLPAALDTGKFDLFCITLCTMCIIVAGFSQ